MIEANVTISEPERVYIHPKATVRVGAVLKAETGWIHVHEGAVIGPYCVIHAKGGVEIGQNTMLSPHVQIYAQNHTFKRFDIPIINQPNIGYGIYVMDDCWIGANTVITDDVTIGKGCVVGAGAVVTKSIPMGRIAVGVPAFVSGNRFSGPWNFPTVERLTSEAPHHYKAHASGRYEWASCQLPENAKKVLDVGCGDGFFTQMIGGRCQAIGVDYTLVDITDYGTGGADFMQMNVTHLRFDDNTFDCVYFLDVLEHLMPMQGIKALTEIYRVMKPGTKLVGTTPVNICAYNTYSHIKEYSYPELCLLLNGIFDGMDVFGDYFVCYKE